ncbi:MULTISPECIES: twin-arginine translocase TatA/TatE family subunit [Microbacterium]|uniref:twin-arginine translocase TatA/TatE family subunit n=1 Tax=Microbacterium TaxID=33882 RepID=UPI0010CA3533|nr:MULTISPECIES: twin-arginine translocase TatA/TatE family subunit [Microbacterium]MDR6198374.1 sec-independent protein translocase protein TatA [Microbacterium sp. SORGH_AS_0428]QCQ16047.1 twin-arginine translocase TatA/TatE family subunit [Microbacterium sp. RG1]UIN29198.1 twin-arginine translocase TatA/TatE family subunit [Microbacterium binotii]
MGAFGWPHLLVILAVILLLFGAAKLPALAKSVGQSARVFRGEMKAMKEDDAAAPSTATTVAPAPTPAESAPKAPDTGTSPDTRA